jgi:signal transduction histidine kinase
MAGDHGNGVDAANFGRVLVVDDDPEVVRFLQLMLERAGYKAMVAYSGPEALERLEETGQPGGEVVSLVLLDIRMPHMDGLEVCRRIRSQPDWATVPVIMVTAMTSISDRIAAFEAGANDYVTKPFHPLELLARVRAFTRLQTAEAQRRRAERALQRRNRELQALYNLTSALARTRSVERILVATIEQVASMFSAEGMAAVLWDENGKTCAHGAVRGTARDLWGEAQGTNPANDLLWEAMRAASGPVVLTGTEVQAQGGVWGQTGATGLVAVPVGQQPIGALIVLCAPEQAAMAANVNLLSAFAQQMGAAVENVHLLEQMAWARMQLRQLTGRVVQVQEEERRRIARELHDEVGQTLTGLKLNLAALEAFLPDQPTTLHEQLADSRALLESMMEEIRGLALELRPAALDDLGLVPALRDYVGGFIKRTSLNVTSDMDATIGRLPEQMETALYRIIQEAMTNIVRHAAARHVQVILRPNGDEVYACVADDGRGFDTTRRLKAAVAEGRMGLLGIQERVALLGGRVKITAAPGNGTRVEIYLPRQRETQR